MWGNYISCIWTKAMCPSHSEAQADENEVVYFTRVGNRR